MVSGTPVEVVVPVRVEDIPGKMVEDTPLADVAVKVDAGDEAIEDRATEDWEPGKEEGGTLIRPVEEVTVDGDSVDKLPEIGDLVAPGLFELFDTVTNVSHMIWEVNCCVITSKSGFVDVVSIWDEVPDGATETVSESLEVDCCVTTGLGDEDAVSICNEVTDAELVTASRS